MTKHMQLSVMNEVVNILIERGFNPYGQIKGYLISGKCNHITTYKNARDMINLLDMDFIANYLDHWQDYQDDKWIIKI